MKRISLVFLGVSMYIAASAQLPGTLSYQGILVNASGDPVTDGNHTVTFNFYTVPSAGTSLFGRGPFTVTTYKGMFTFVIGTGAPAGNDPLTVLASDPHYIGGSQFYVEVVADGTTLSPRVQLSSVPNAFHAHNANTMNASGLTGAGTLPNTVLDADLQDLADGVLSGNKIDGTAITALNAANLTTGLMSDARLESTVDINSLNVGGQFSVGSDGNIFKIRNVATSFPTVQGAAGTFLSNDGTGNLSWVSGGGGSGWALTGNSGTVDGTSFIGTTDNVALNFRVNNQKAGRLDPALMNAFYGFLSGNTNSIGSNNTAIGTNSLYANVGGSSATAIGYGAMQYTYDQASAFVNANVAVGFEALRGSTTASSNTGNENTAIGHQALLAATSGGYNVAVGTAALSTNTTGTSNVGIGRRALDNNTTGSNNTAIGYNSRTNSNNLTNATAIGANATVSTSNSLVLGGTGADAVKVGIGKTNPSQALDVVGSVQFSQALLPNGTAGSTGDVLVSQGSALPPIWTTGGGSGWGLSGSSGTVDGTNFIGTTDNVALNFKVNNLKAGRLDAALSNTFFGVDAGTNTSTGQNNVAIGRFALASNVGGRLATAVGSGAMRYSNSQGTGFDNFNTAVGYEALRGSGVPANNTGNYNVALGLQSLFVNTTGSYNVALGSDALYTNTSGSNNVVAGTSAMQENNTGSFNVAYGGEALFANVAGMSATAIGHKAMRNSNSQATGFSNRNIAIGFETLMGSATPSANTGNDNTAIGYRAMPANTTGDNNISIGNQALFSNTTGDGNIAIGSGALINNTTGNNNTVIGLQAGQDNTASDNHFVGAGAGLSNTTGGQNYFSGNSAGLSNTTGINNYFSGYHAGYASTASVNHFVGFNAGVATTTGTQNHFTGYAAGQTNTTGSNNTAIGYLANVSSGNLANAAAIGNGAVVNASNKIRLGNSSVTVIEGQVAFSASSDARLKTDVKTLTSGLDFITQLRPMSYKMKNEHDTRTNWGFIAQDIEMLLGTNNAILTVGGDESRTLGLRYTDFIAPMVKAIQEQQQLIVDQQNEIDILMKGQSEIEDLKKEIAELKSLISSTIPPSKQIATSTANGQK